MKIKLAYPKIPNTLNCPLKECIAFSKEDGTNIHFVWNPIDGWARFGTRRDRFDISTGGEKQFQQAHPELTGVLDLLRGWVDRWEELVMTQSELRGAQEVIVFAEYFGPNSFAGSHDPKDQKQLVIFDVQVDGVMLPPDQFIKLFADFPIAKVVFQGKFTGQLFSDVRQGKYPVQEGVVVKGVVNGQVYMAKVKTNDYLRKLKEIIPNSWKDYWE